MKTLLHESWQDVQGLSDRWNSLLTESSSNTIFLTWEWLEAWWNNYGRDRALFVLSAWEGDSLEGLAPLFLDRFRRWGAKRTCLRLIGDGSHDSDYLDCIGRRGRENEVIAAFLECQRSRWDCLEFHGTLECSPCLAALMNFARGKSWTISSEPIPCATLSLPRNWNNYLRLLKPRFRTRVRTTLSYFEEKIGATPVPCGDSREIEQWLRILFDLHTRRW